MSPLVPRLHPTERVDALRYVAEDQVEAFTLRQRASRVRVARINAFYLRYPCRMGALHRLAVAGIAVSRSAGLSEAYHQIGELLCPVDLDGQPRTEGWRAFVHAFEQGCPGDLREERWLQAHFTDMEQVKAAGWLERFALEEEAHRGDPAWRMLGEHMEVTLGTRLEDGQALAGALALETAIAASLARVARRQLVTGLGLVRTYVRDAIRATLAGGPWVPPHAPSDRALVCCLVRATASAVRIRRVWRLGLARRQRGAEGPGAAWSLSPSLERVLGPRLEQMDPTVHALFSSMDRFTMTASVHLHHRLTTWMAWLATLLVGQGMYEESLEQVPARFRLFRRDDGSLHFVREFWCDEAVRVFDSDFVVRWIDGQPTLLEVFQQLGIAAQMRTEVLDDGGVSMTIVRLFIRGVPVGVGPARVCFETRPHAPGQLQVVGVLELAPRTASVRWVLRRLLRLPERLGEIRYLATDSGPRIA
ncbi:MAG TPA: hypothetical protein ENK18_00165 [Deltaproteobacteria bacterium]|nr:hypothetical protein [Deltaproteobacteria bacterium]